MLEKGKVSFPLSNSWYIQAFYVANGCTLFGDGTDAAAGVDFSGDKAAAVTEYLVDLCKNPNFINDADGAGIAGLRDGSVNAIFSGTWDAESVKEALGDNMGVAALPTVNIGGTEGQMKSFIGSKAIGVNPNTENMQVSMALAAYLAGEDAQKDHYDMRNILPTNTNIAISDDEIATAVTKVMTDTSIMQPLVSEMSNYWSPAENMGKAARIPWSAGNRLRKQFFCGRAYKDDLRLRRCPHSYRCRRSRRSDFFRYSYQREQSALWCGKAVASIRHAGRIRLKRHRRNRSLTCMYHIFL